MYSKYVAFKLGIAKFDAKVCDSESVEVGAEAQPVLGGMGVLQLGMIVGEEQENAELFRQSEASWLKAYKEVDNAISEALSTQRGISSFGIMHEG